MRRLTPVLLALLPALVVVVPLRAEESAKPSVQVLDQSLAHQGRNRTYRLLVPPGHDPATPVPLVLALHGGGGEAAQLDRSTGGQFEREVLRRGWIVAFPQGIANGWNDGRRIASRRARERRGVDDVAFLRAVIDRVCTTHGVDPSRVYATGISNGGFMAYRLGLELSDRIAAIAPVTANLQKVHEEKTPSHPVGLLVINGTDDPLVPYEGGQVRVFGRARGRILSTDATVRRWASFTECAGEPTTRLLPDAAPRDGTRAHLTAWPAGLEGARVHLVRIQGGGHTWPGGRQYLSARIVGRVCRDFQAVPLIFAFFEKHARRPPDGPGGAPRGR